LVFFRADSPFFLRVCGVSGGLRATARAHEFHRFSRSQARASLGFIKDQAGIATR
jgi:hypothetical protein